jgi:hypothetical protein
MVEQQDAHPRMQQAHLGELDRSEDMQVVQSAVHFHSTWVVSHLFAVSVCGMLQDTFCLIAISVSTLSATYLDFRVFRQSVGQYSRMGAKQIGVRLRSAKTENSLGRKHGDGLLSQNSQPRVGKSDRGFCERTVSRFPGFLKRRNLPEDMGER